MEPQEVLGHAQEWLIAAGTFVTLLAATVLAIAKIAIDLRKKLHVIIESVEDHQSPALKRIIAEKAKTAGIDLKQDVDQVTKKKEGLE